MPAWEDSLSNADEVDLSDGILFLLSRQSLKSEGLPFFAYLQAALDEPRGIHDRRAKLQEVEVGRAIWTAVLFNAPKTREASKGLSKGLLCIAGCAAPTLLPIFRLWRWLVWPGEMRRACLLLLVGE